MRKLIISRHPAAVEFVRTVCPDFVDAEVLASATCEDLAGADVVGNLPLHRATVCGRFRTIEFAGAPPQGAEYSLADMKAAGARLVEYVVLHVSREALVETLRRAGVDACVLGGLSPQGE